MVNDKKRTIESEEVMPEEEPTVVESQADAAEQVAADTSTPEPRKLRPFNIGDKQTIPDSANGRHFNNLQGLVAATNTPEGIVLVAVKAGKGELEWFDARGAKQPAVEIEVIENGSD